MSSRYDTEEIDLSTGRTDPADYYELETTRQRLLFAQVPADCELHDGDREADGVPLERGDTDCAPQGTPGAHTWYISNPAGSGTLVVVITDDPSLCLSDVGAASSTGLAPERLGGDLAAGSGFNDGDDASEDVDTQGAAKAVVRAQVSGISATTTSSTVLDRVTALALDEERGLLYALDDDSSQVTLSVVDLSEPEAPTVAGSVNVGTLDRVPAGGQLAYDPDNHKVVGAGYDDAAGDPFEVFTVDVSDPTAPSVDGQTATTMSGSGGSGTMHARYDPHRQRVVLGLANGGAGTDARSTFVVDHTGGAAPSLEAEKTGEVLVALQPGESESYAWTVEDSNGNLFKRRYTEDAWAGLDAVNGDKNWKLNSTGDADPELGLIFVTQNTDNNLEAVDAETGNILYTLGDDALVAYADTDLQMLVAVQQDSIFFSYDRGGASQVAQNGSGSNHTMVGAYSGRYWYQAEFSTIWLVDFDPGSDLLVVQALDPTGTPVVTGGDATGTLRDGDEVKVELPLDGEDQVRVEHRARSGTGGTRDHFDVYREEL